MLAGALDLAPRDSGFALDGALAALLTPARKWGRLLHFRSLNLPHPKFALLEGIEIQPREGLGANERTLKNLCRDDIQASDLIDRALQGKPGGQVDNQNASKSETNVDIVTIRLRPHGNSRNGALRRLRKDAPELHGRVLAGDLSAPSMSESMPSIPRLSRSRSFCFARKSRLPT